VLVNVFSQVDRQLMSILVEPIKAEFGLSDAQLGLLVGLAFAAFYTLAGVPIARIADRRNRRNLIAICLALWSAFTALCGAAQGYTSLLIARFGVGIGEAGCAPAAQSMLADYFPHRERGRALAIFQLGVPLGLLLGPTLGGFLADAYGWRVAFYVIGLPGLFFAGAVWIALREPMRGRFDTDARAELDVPPVRDTLRYLWRLRTMRHVLAAAALHTATAGAWAIFVPAFLMRAHALSAAEAGWRFGIVAGVAGGIGTFAGGWLGDRLGARDSRWYIWTPMLGAFLAMPAAVLAFSTNRLGLALVALAVMQIGSLTYTGVIHAITQSLVTTRMRAITAAIALLVMNLVGFGGGPYLAGAMSDRFGGTGGLGSALIAMNGLLLWACLHYALAARTYRQDLGDRHD
jgi:predicted MFS family arabinose efflux permease